MDSMKVRYQIKNLYLKVGNVTRDQESYVLLKAFDDSNNEIVLELTHEQAGFLEDQFYEANRRWEDRISTVEPVSDTELAPHVFEFNDEYNGDQYTP
ncbi:hypothetical protein CVD25_09650 [Bacillus canaveralius]|uniref:Uncharacterized protein n=1 Tax=Bacillus canaveralius TaxID=1403243 RepID=A0A2N5GGF6_9BACI|nr:MULTISPECIES: hypothetical protein [Bacillus]PLR79847.1 hypothetical protein CU635_20920 [Bacillus canaveralius]PLR87185.1 hypothetical protein CVD23_04210 [Bacillus sp. V33-4]PLR97804.1 hypothetical protein CVD25_09650 [Bacillus canaveralius]RSK45557.1 hypothetical protein EJA13_19200 [Bacillus canaveralius]